MVPRYATDVSGMANGAACTAIFFLLFRFVRIGTGGGPIVYCLRLSGWRSVKWLTGPKSSAPAALGPPVP